MTNRIRAQGGRKAFQLVARLSERPNVMTGVSVVLQRLHEQRECHRDGHQPARIPSGTICLRCGQRWIHS
jgi:hypothetical protein